MPITVPITGASVVPEGEGPSRDSAPPSPLAQRKSLHTVRMASTVAQPEYEPQWKENGQLRWVPAEVAEEPAAAEQVVDSPVPRGDGFPDNGAQQAQPYDALRQEIAELKQTMLMSQGQGGQPQQPQVPQPPDPTQFDFFEARDVAEFHRLNNAYIQATVRHEIDTAMAPHGVALQDAQLISEHNRLVASHGEDPNFKAKMNVAIDLYAKFRDRMSLTEAFDAAYVPSQPTLPQQPAAQPQSYAKPGQRTLTAQEAAQKAAQAHSLPPRNGVSGAAEPALPTSLMNVGALGRIMLHNQQTGRARPI